MSDVMDRLRELRHAHPTSEAFARAARDEDLIRSMSEGRRIFHGLSKHADLRKVRRSIK